MRSHQKIRSTMTAYQKQGFGRLEVDKQFYFCDQLDRQFGGIFVLEDGYGINASLAMRLHEIASVTHQAAGDTEVAGLVDCRHHMADG